MKDVTNTSGNSTHGKSGGSVLHMKKYTNLEDVKENVDENTKVQIGGKIFQKVGVGFKSIIRPYEVEHILRSRVIAALNATQASQAPVLHTIQLNTDPASQPVQETLTQIHL